MTRAVPHGEGLRLQRLHHAVSRGDLEALVAACAEAQSSPLLPPPPLSPPTAAADVYPYLSKHLLFSSVRAGHVNVTAHLLDRHEAARAAAGAAEDVAVLVDNRGK